MPVEREHSLGSDSEVLRQTLHNFAWELMRYEDDEIRQIVLPSVLEKIVHQAAIVGERPLLAAYLLNLNSFRASVDKNLQYGSCLRRNYKNSVSEYFLDRQISDRLNELAENAVTNFIRFIITSFKRITSKLSYNKIITDVAFPDSDSHNLGKSTFFVKVLHEGWLVYKPVNPGPQQLFQRFFSFVATSITGKAPPLYDVVDCSCDFALYRYKTYNGIIGNESEATEFFFHFGILLSVAHVLSVRDLHFENIIVCDRNPVPIDIEVIGACDVDEFSNLIDTGLIGFDGTDALKGGGHVFRFGVFEKQMSNKYSKVEHWQRDYRPFNKIRSNNRGDIFDPTGYRDTLIAGFTQGYWEIARSVSSYYEVIVNFLKEFAVIGEFQSRVILRPTLVYDAILVQFFRPEVGNKREAIRYARNKLYDLPANSSVCRNKPILDVEVGDFLGCDIPYFWTNDSSKSLLHLKAVCARGFFRGELQDRIQYSLYTLGSHDFERRIDELHEVLKG